MTLDLFTDPAAPVSAETDSAGTGDGPTVVGLDLALATTGIAYLDGTTNTIETAPAQPRPVRLIAIRNAVLAGPADADLLVIEDLPKHVQHGGVELGMVHGVVRTALHERGTPVLFVPPATLKTYATGKGNAPKDDIRAELIKRLGIDIREPNERDAWVLRAIGLEMLGHPVAKMPANHRAPLAKLTMPALRGAP